MFANLGIILIVLPIIAKRGLAKFGRNTPPSIMHGEKLFYKFAISYLLVRLHQELLIGIRSS